VQIGAGTSRGQRETEMGFVKFVVRVKFFFFFKIHFGKHMSFYCTVEYGA
jgi:hypothetical protein